MTHWPLTPAYAAEFGLTLHAATDWSFAAPQPLLLIALSLTLCAGLVAVGFAWKRLARKLTQPYRHRMRLAETVS